LSTRITQDIFWKVHKNGFILEDTVDQLQCQDCKRYNINIDKYAW